MMVQELRCAPDVLKTHLNRMFLLLQTSKIPSIGQISMARNCALRKSFIWKRKLEEWTVFVSRQKLRT